MKRLIFSYPKPMKKTIINPRKVLFLKIAYISFFIVGALSAFFSNNASLSFPSIYKMGQIFGVLGITVLTLQLWFISRLPALERGVGMEKLTRWHKNNSRLFATFIILHPIFLFGPSILNGSSIFTIINSFTIYHKLGGLALFLIFATMFTTIYSKRLKLNYEHWKIIHKVGYLIVTLGFIHSFFLGSDITSGQPLYYWWIFLAVSATIPAFYRLILRPFKLRHNIFKVTKLVKETKDVRSIYLEALNGAVLRAAPGQFAYVKFKSKSVSPEEHHFTLSSTPSDKFLSFTVKSSGDFTSTLDNLKIGELATIEGPFGAFSNQGMAGPFVFIAGGIGITPIMSMLRSNHLDKTTLIYANQYLNEAVFREELEKIKKSTKSFHLIYVLSKEKKNGTHHGRISQEIIKKEVTDIPVAKYFLCGPPEMIKATVKILKQFNVPSSQIFSEVFALR